MTSLFPHPQYAKDQPYASSILYLHVMRASAMSFSFFSLLHFPFFIIAARSCKIPVQYNMILSRTLKAAGRGLVLGTAAGAFMTWGRMRDREEIEWKNRSWRILENNGEVKTDWITLGAAGGGAVATMFAARRGSLPLSMGRAVLGGAGVGMTSGVPYMNATFSSGRKPA
ncbi:hypothetical protein G6011_07707 [Alternaria panax]|uniref:Uncharacterized protein n=1 Tax=Alternaria panax TaxID=48097 RepID=A0AAD4FAI7_9PLEO|nr:hypothetical protein G6011_07707 [Alternaria panax]